MTATFDGLRGVGVPVRTACLLTGRSRATHYRHTRPTPARPAPTPHAQRNAPTQTLSPAERARVLQVINSDGYATLSIGQIWIRELDDGRYWCSLSSMYRIARKAAR